MRIIKRERILKNWVGRKSRRKRKDIKNQGRRGIKEEKRKDIKRERILRNKKGEKTRRRERIDLRNRRGKIKEEERKDISKMER